ncbi:MAG: hypothetical protein AAGF44_12135 [Pseudomonadota bacterium]
MSGRDLALHAFAQDPTQREDQHLAGFFNGLGRIATRTCAHVECWLHTAGSTRSAWDLAASASLLQEWMHLRDLLAACLRVYCRLRHWPAVDTAEVDRSGVPFQRMALLAWTGIQINLPERQAGALHCTRNTAVLAERYLTQFGSASP